MDGFPRRREVFTQLDGRWIVKVERVLHFPGWMVLGNEQRVHVPASGLDIIIHEFREAHLEENRSYALDQGLHRVAPTGSRRGRLQRNIERSVLSVFPIFALEKFRRQFGDDIGFLKFIGRNLLPLRRKGPSTLDFFDDLNQVFTSAKMVQHVGIDIADFCWKGP